MAPSPEPAPRPYRRSRVFAWALYDVANSSFTTLVVTFIYSTYFIGYMSGSGDDLTPLWTLGVGTTALLVALLTPILGAIADRGGFRKRFLLSFSAVCVAATAGLTFLPPGQEHLAIVVFVLANLCFEMGAAFYDSFLPDLVPQEKIGRVSGLGWGIGYVGGIAALLLALYGFIKTDTGLYASLSGLFGFSNEAGGNVRATNLLVAVWFGIFTLPFIFLVPEPRIAGQPAQGNALTAGFRQLASSFREIRRYRQIIRLIVARLIYNDGLVVIFALGAAFAQQVYGFTQEETLTFGVVLNVAAGFGALVFGFLDDKIGGRNTVLMSLVGLTLAGLLAILGQTPGTFWAAAVFVGLLVGPNQAASRSLLGRFVPNDKEAEFFGFFAFSGKATAFLGPILYGQLLLATHNHRIAMIVSVVFFLIGGLLLLRVNEREGIAAAGRSGTPPTTP